MANVLQGSEREPLAGARAVGKWDSAERIRVSVLVRRSAANAFSAHVATMAASATPAAPMERAEFARRFGAGAADVAAVRTFANAHRLTVVEEDLARRTLVLEGTVADFETAFGVELQRYEYPGGAYRGRVGPIYVPAELDGVVQAVLGLDDRPQARPQFRVRATSAAASFTPPEVAALYKFPAASGAGQCIGLIELGGGFVTADLTSYFAGLHVAMPAVFCGFGRRREKRTDRRPERTRRRSDARYRSCRARSLRTLRSLPTSRRTPTRVSSMRSRLRCTTRRTSRASCRSVGAVPNRAGRSKR